MPLMIWKAITGALTTIATRMVVAMASEKVLTFLTVKGLRKLASLTTNTVDDDMVDLMVTEMKDRNLPEAEKA